MENVQTKQQNPEGNPALTVFAILGFIALLIAGLWSTIQLIKQGSQLISGAGNRGVSSFMGLGNTGVALKIGSKNVTAGEAFTVTWSVAKTSDGTLALTYACRENVYVQVNTQDAAYALPCNAPYTVASDTQSLSLTAVSTNKEAVEVPLTLSFTTTTGKVSKDMVNLSVSTEKNAVVAEKPDATKPVATIPTLATTPIPATTPKVPTPVKNEPKPEPKPVAKAPVLVPVKKSDETGQADLKPAIEAIGVIANGKFVEKTIFAATDTVVVKFTVTNLGTKVAKGWTFNATLPANPTYTYTSSAQEDLYAGASAHLSMTFDKLATGTGVITINVDAANAIVEVSNANNGVSRQIVVQ
jgi:hypothetical protein